MQKLENGLRSVTSGLHEPDLPPSLPPARDSSSQQPSAPAPSRSTDAAISAASTTPAQAVRVAAEASAPSTGKKYKLNSMSQSELVVLCQDLHRRVRSTKASLREARLAAAEKSAAAAEAAERLQYEAAERKATIDELTISKTALRDSETTCRRLAGEVDAVRADLHKVTQEAERCHAELASLKEQKQLLEKQRTDLDTQVQDLKEHTISGTPDAQRLEQAEMHSAQRAAQVKGLQREMAALAKQNDALKSSIAQFQAAAAAARPSGAGGSSAVSAEPQLQSAPSSSNSTAVDAQQRAGRSSGVSGDDDLALGHIRHLVLATVAAGGVQPDALPLVKAALAKALKCSAKETQRLLQC